MPHLWLRVASSPVRIKLSRNAIFSLQRVSTLPCGFPRGNNIKGWVTWPLATSSLPPVRQWVGPSLVGSLMVIFTGICCLGNVMLWCKEASICHILTVMCELNQCTLGLSTRKDASQPPCSTLPSPSINFNLHPHLPDSCARLRHNGEKKNPCKNFPTKPPVLPFSVKNLKTAVS